MKIYIAADIEGVSGIWGEWQLDPDKPWWMEARRLQTQEINAAVQGALDAGATEVVVWDNHNGGHTALIEEIHENAYIVMGWPHNPRFPGLDETFDGVYLIGYHAMSGTADAVLDHTYTPKMRSVFLNGQGMGEVEFDALWAGLKGVPILLVTGDDKVCAEARRFLGDIETAVVKEGIHRHMAKMLSPKRARALIREKARLAVRKIGQVEPFRLDPPYEKKIVFANADLAEGRTFDGHRIERLDAQTIVYRSNDLLDILTLW